MQKHLIGLLLAAFLCSTAARAEDWPQWRGLNSDDLSSELSGWRDGTWPIKERWSKQVGEGCTSPVVARGKVYTLGWNQGKDHVYALDLETGTEQWKRSYACPKYGRYAAGAGDKKGGMADRLPRRPSTRSQAAFIR